MGRVEEKEGRMEEKEGRREGWKGLKRDLRDLWDLQDWESEL